jgi:nitrogen regulatory protein P-II 1
MNKIEAIMRVETAGRVKDALASSGFVGLHTVHVTGRGQQKGITQQGRTGERYTVDMLPKLKLEIVVPDAGTQRVVDIIIANARTGSIGDGKIFISPVANAIRIRTGEQGDAVL